MLPTAPTFRVLADSGSHFLLSLAPLSVFFLALNASFPAESINIAEVRLERPLSNETALARAWILLLGALLATLSFCNRKSTLTEKSSFISSRWLD